MLLEATDEYTSVRESLRDNSNEGGSLLRKRISPFSPSIISNRTGSPFLTTVMPAFQSFHHCLALITIKVVRRGVRIGRFKVQLLPFIPNFLGFFVHSVTCSSTLHSLVLSPKFWLSLSFQNPNPTHFFATPRRVVSLTPNPSPQSNSLSRCLTTKQLATNQSTSTSLLGKRRWELIGKLSDTS